MTTYSGRCHCGCIGFRYITSVPPDSWSLRICRCSFCRAHGARYVSDPAGTVDFVLTKPEFLVRYRFGSRTADFLLCRGCGVYVGARMTTAAGGFSIINVNALTIEPLNMPSAEPVTYDGESSEERVARREARWTPLGEMQRRSGSGC